MGTQSKQVLIKNIKGFKTFDVIYFSRHKLTVLLTRLL